MRPKSKPLSPAQERAIATLYDRVSDGLMSEERAAVIEAEIRADVGIATMINVLTEE